MVMCLSLTDGGLRNVLAIHIDVARLASFHAARAGHPDPDWCWTLVMQVPLVSLYWSKKIIPLDDKGIAAGD